MKRKQVGCVLLKGFRLMTRGEADCSADGQAPVARGMTVRSRDGDNLGYVAAVLAGSENSRLVSIILGHLPDQTRYQSIPAAWIERVEAEDVLLGVDADTVRQLLDWHPEPQG